MQVGIAQASVAQVGVDHNASSPQTSRSSTVTTGTSTLTPTNKN